MRIARMALAGALALPGPGLVAPAAGSGAAVPTHCPRACMEGLVDQYWPPWCDTIGRGCRCPGACGSPRVMGNLAAPRPALVADVPAAERTPRWAMVNAADSYFEAIEHNDGSLAPFAPNCDRRENGAKTTNNTPPVPWPVPLGSPEADRGMSLSARWAAPPSSTPG